MPTGYTADVPKGISFQTFAMNCARAFGACIMLRDEPGGGDRIPDRFEPDSYHKDAAERARAELADLESLGHGECARRAAVEWKESEQSRLRREQEREDTRRAYEQMLAQVKAWEAPTAEHAGLKTFMIDQLEQSIDFDCNYTASQPAPRLSADEWRNQRRVSLAKDIAYHDREYANEVKRTEERTAWVQALRASLEPKP